MGSWGHLRGTGRPVPRQQGFTLIEIIVVVAILAIAAGMALPNLREALVRNTVTASTNDLIADLSTARAEAVKRGFTTAVIAKSGGWTNGWDIRVDADGDGVYTGSNDIYIREHGPLAENFRLLGAPKSGTGATLVSFNGSGAAPGGDYDFALCRPDSNNEQHRAILVQRNGSVSSRRKPTGLVVSC